MYIKGQRWYSEGEPELGLGLVMGAANKRIEMYFPLSNEQRIYSAQNPPLKRFSLKVGDKFTTSEQVEFLVKDIQENEGIIFYLGEDDSIVPEMSLDSKIDLSGPLHRLQAANFDSPQFNQLRYQSYLNTRHYQEFPYKGFLGAKIRLIPHQAYVVNTVLEMQSPKVMLCDEVGLGKTIEAALILHSLIQNELVENCLIVVPDSLVNQWFVELYKKFNLSFLTLNSETEDIDFSTARRVIVSSKMINEDPAIAAELEQISWDMLIIDESHQFNFADQEAPSIKLFQQINEKCHAALFLSATPEVLGAKNLFNQLHFLDKDKYTSFEDFQSLITTSQSISKLITQKNLLTKYDALKDYFTKAEFDQFETEEELTQAIIDRFGTGRNYFRNSRSNLENYSRLFNDRILHPYAISLDSKINDKIVLENKTGILVDLIKRFPEDKILVICHSKSVVLKLQRHLLELDNFKLAMFHSDQSLMERDRQASYFADEAGAQILLSTEVGAEGRNFEFASHLVLFDLPKLPDQLEQRIGRLDRIGQKSDINIHIPYVSHTFEETLFRWYHEVLDAFSSCPKGANAFYESHHEALVSLLEAPFDVTTANGFLNTHQATYQKYQKELEEGRDLIVETHSYNDTAAKQIIHDIRDYEEKNSTFQYVDNVFNAIGINFEELNDFVYFIKPSDNMLIPSFPGLSSEGQSVTFDREYSLKFDHIALLSWEHPITKGCFELLLSSPLGNCSAVKQDRLPRGIYFEFIVTLQCSDEFKHISAKYLPFTPIRLLLEATGQDVTKKYPKRFIDEHQEALEHQDMAILDNIPKDMLAKLFTKAQDMAQAKSNKYLQDAKDTFTKDIFHEEKRVSSLHITAQEKQTQLANLAKIKESITGSIQNASLTIDAIKIILPME